MESIKVLIVDDDRDLANSTKMLFGLDEWKRYRVEVAFSFDEALEKFQALNPDIALIDNKLGNKSGAELIVKFHEIKPDLLCVVTTGFAEVQQVYRYIQGGAIEALLKPVDPQQLLFGLNRWSKQIEYLRENIIIEKKLKESQRLFAKLTSISPVGIWRSDLEGHCTYINQKGCEIMGLDIAEAMGFGWTTTLHPEDKERVTRSWEDASASQSAFTSQHRFLHSSGEVVWALSEAVLDRDNDGKKIGYIGTLTDITAQKTTEGHLRNYQTKLESMVEDKAKEVIRAEKRFRSYFELPLIGIAITSPSKGWIDVNEKLCQIFGYDREALLKMTWTEITHPDDLEKDVAMFNRVINGEMDGYSMDKRFIRKDGGMIYASISARCIRLANGDVDYFVALVQDITDSKKNERAKFLVEERLQRVVVGSNDIFWEWDVNIDKVWWSPKFYEILGYEEGAFVTTYASFPKLMHPDDVEPVYKLINDHLENDTPYEAQYRLRTASDAYRWFYARGKVTRDEMGKPVLFSGSAQDITDRKNMEVALEANEARQRAIISSSPIPLALNDEQQNITFLNASFVETFGYTLADIPTLKEWWPKAYPDPAYRQWVMDTWQAELERAKRENALFSPMEFNIRCADGTVKTVLVKASALEKEFQGTHLVVLFDITGRKQTEKKLTLYAEELARSNEALKDFATSVSHDLQEPLRKIIAFGDRLRSACALDEQGGDYLGRMQKATLRMQGFINDLLELSKVSYKPRQLQLIDLRAVVSEVVSDLESQIKKTQGTLEIRCLPSIEADNLQMRQLFQNMISNALKFHKPGGSPRVLVNSREAGPEHWEITIQDNGIGFDNKYLDRILKPFQRLHGPSEFGGRGMGLAICQKVIENHNGKIKADSAPGKGTCFTILLPKKQRLDD